MAATVSTFNATRPFHSAVIMASTAQELSTSVNVTWATVQSEFVEVKIATTVERYKLGYGVDGAAGRVIFLFNCIKLYQKKIRESNTDAKIVDIFIRVFCQPAEKLHQSMILTCIAC